MIENVVIFTGSQCRAAHASALRAEYAKFNLNAFVFSYPGHDDGGDPSSNWLDDYAEAGHAWLNERRLSPVFLVGHSMGSEVVRRIAERCPRVSAVAYLCTPSSVPFHLSIYKELALQPDYRRAMLRCKRRPCTFSLTDEDIARYYYGPGEEPLVPHVPESARAVRQLMLQPFEWHAPNRREYAEAVVGASDDALTTWDTQVKAAWKRGIKKLIKVPGYHMSPLTTSSPIVAKESYRWLESLKLVEPRRYPQAA